MKVLQFVSCSADTEYLKNLGKGLASSGIEIIFVTLFKSGHDTPEWISKIKSAKYYCLNATKRLDFPHAVWKLSRILKHDNVEILQTHLYEASLVGLLAAKITRVPLRILTRHHTDQAKYWAIGGQSQSIVGRQGRPTKSWFS